MVCGTAVCICCLQMSCTGGGAPTALYCSVQDGTEVREFGLVRQAKQQQHGRKTFPAL